MEDFDVRKLLGDPRNVTQPSQRLNDTLLKGGRKMVRRTTFYVSRYAFLFQQD